MISPLLLTDRAVLQAGVEIPLLGAARPRTEVRVALAGQRASGVADAEGRWRMTLGPFPPGGPHTLVLDRSDEASLTLRDLLVGEVWVCAGQSNMEFPLKDAEGAKEALAGSDRPRMRLFNVAHRVCDAPRADLPGGAWEVCGPGTAASFSAVGYFFGAHLQDELGVPVGLIEAAVGATPGEAWMPLEALAADADLQPILDRRRRSLEVYPDPQGTYEKAFAEWDRVADQAERQGRPIPGAHPKLIGPEHPWTPAGLFNGMIAPLTSYPVRGVIWYQGEAAPERAYQYRKLFRVLIRSWRQAWGRTEMPFLFVQAPAFGPRRSQPCEHSWAELREAQQMALAEANTAMAVAIDCGGEKNIHPARKKPLGDRLALAARAKAYGQEIVWSGPLFRGMAVEGSRVRLRFDHAAGGLRTSDGRPPRGFAVSGGATDFSAGNRNFVWAQARIQGNEVLVQSPRVPMPQAVRYAWAQNPDCNLVNAQGLPAAPFRTDDYPGVTVANR